MERKNKDLTVKEVAIKRAKVIQSLSPYRSASTLKLSRIAEKDLPN